MGRIWQLRFCLIILLAAVQASSGSIAKAYFEGGFPGRGSYEGWQKANLQYYKGIEFQQEGKIEEAQASFDSATKIYRYDSRYWNSLGICRQQSKNQLEAEQAFRTATSVNPTDKQSWICLRNLLKAEGRNTEATELDVKIQRIDASSPGSGSDNSTQWQEKEEKDKDTPLGLLKKYYVGN